MAGGGGIEARIRDNRLFICSIQLCARLPQPSTSGTTRSSSTAKHTSSMYTKVPLADEGLFYTQQIDFEPVEVVIIEDYDTPESFDEYLWMENEEEFEKSEMQRLQEEALMEECAEAMQDDDEDGEEEDDVLECLRLCHTDDQSHLFLSESTLNPLANEFIPAN